MALLEGRFIRHGEYGAWIVEDHDFRFGDCYSVIIAHLPSNKRVDGSFGILYLEDATVEARQLLELNNDQ